MWDDSKTTDWRKNMRDRSCKSDPHAPVGRVFLSRFTSMLAQTIDRFHAIVCMAIQVRIFCGPPLLIAGSGCE
jgi:hypothetical protein